MAIFRGPGGSGDATTDSTTQALAATQAAADALASKNAAAASAVSATASETNAANSASAAAASAASVSINLTTTGNTILGDASTDTLNVGNGGLVKDASGNVGIGTASIGANHALEIVGSQKYLAVTANTGYPTSANPSQSSGLFFGWNKSAGGGESNIVYGTGGGSTPALQFASWNGTTYSERMRIDASGNVGIGVTPTQRLDVVGTSSIFRNNAGNAFSTDGITLLNAGAFTGYNSSVGSVFSVGAQNDSSVNGGAVYRWVFGLNGNANGQALTFSSATRTGGAALSERMRIDTNGNLMVGTTTATGKLTVAGNIAINNAKITANYNSSDINAQSFAFWRLGTLSGGGGDLLVSMHSVDASTPNAAQYRITYYITTTGLVGAVSTKNALIANNVYLVKDGTYLYLAVQKGNPNGVAYWSVQLTSSFGSVQDLAQTQAANLTGYTTVYTV